MMIRALVRRLPRLLRGVVARLLPGMPTCKDIEGFIDAYLDGTLPEDERARFDLHLRMCPDCEVYLEAYRQTIAMARSLCEDPYEIPEELPDDLVQAILAARRGH